jgi:hypothetical protein
MTIAVLVLACSAPSSDTDTDTGSSASSPATTDTGTPPAPAAITSHAWSCTDTTTTGSTGHVHLFVGTDLDVAAGDWFVAMTGAGADTYTEEHPLAPEAGGVGVELLVYHFEPGEGTSLECHDLDATDYPTFVARVYDAAGELDDCVAWGVDPVGLLAGDYDAELRDLPSSLAELDGCRVE